VLTIKQMDEINMAHQRVVKLAMKSEKLQPGTATHRRTEKAYGSAEAAFQKLILSLVGVSVDMPGRHAQYMIKD